MLSCFKPKKEKKKDISLVCLGLNGVGKTSILRLLGGDQFEGDPPPTFGFNNQAFSFRGKAFTVIDCGGAVKYRALWEFYFDKVDGVVFVVDSQDQARIEESGSELVKLLSNPELKHKPFLILNHKKEESDGVTEEFLYKFFGLSDIIDREFHVLSTSIKDPTKIYSGFAWILNKTHI